MRSREGEGASWTTPAGNRQLRLHAKRWTAAASPPATKGTSIYAPGKVSTGPLARSARFRGLYARPSARLRPAHHRDPHLGLRVRRHQERTVGAPAHAVRAPALRARVRAARAARARARWTLEAAPAGAMED